MSRPPGWLFLVATAIVACISFYLTSVPFVYFEAFVFMFFAWGLLGFVLAIRMVVSAWRTRRWPLGVRWLLVPLIFGVVVTVTSVDAPFQVRFALSESSLASYAANLAKTGHAAGCEWVGLYYVCGTHEYNGVPVLGGDKIIPGGVLFLVTDEPLISSRGFAWLPHGGEPEVDGVDDYKHLTGPWFGIKEWDGV